MNHKTFRKILFICTGNTCRSPMAAALFRDLCARRGVDCPPVESAGLSVYFSSPASPNARLAMEEVSVDLSGHLSRQLAPELFDEGTLLVPMTSSHRAALLKLGVPEENLFSLGEIDDPFGGDAEDYRRTRNLLTQRLEELFAYLFPQAGEEQGQ